MAEDFFCCIYEAKVVADLRHPHTRNDARLTVAERQRLLTAFYHSWDLLRNLQVSGENARSALPALSPRALFLAFETVGFMHDHVEEPYMRHISRLLGGDRDVFEKLGIAAVLRLCLLFNERLGQLAEDETSVYRGYCLPPKTPLGLFAAFDHWQEICEELFGEF
ncbi:uncharacterized protein EI97DRAFT_455753 [Westerdykella ornata]|uniref:Uncharacterized protein n=1 Tax=Westerdykella ornata TaxID=318751 RepID=A0A6A6JSI9_WESOR|nr:uncharacterized protein EI97DRAFT_455753 [Westerdykella ornata]KAF2279522.1 hypothetical protein EI97DRAFT_455753 [Westerdykella ornata]